MSIKIKLVQYDRRILSREDEIIIKLRISDYIRINTGESYFTDNFPIVVDGKKVELLKRDFYNCNPNFKNVDNSRFMKFLVKIQCFFFKLFPWRRIQNTYLGLLKE